MTPEQQKRLKRLKAERNKWWGTVPRSLGIGDCKFKPVRNGEKPSTAFCIMRDDRVIAVEVWIDNMNYKRVFPYKGTASGRVWPTLEGAYLALIDKAFREHKKLLDELTRLDGVIKSYERAIDAL